MFTNPCSCGQAYKVVQPSNILLLKLRSTKRPMKCFNTSQNGHGRIIRTYKILIFGFPHTHYLWLFASGMFTSPVVVSLFGQLMLTYSVHVATRGFVHRPCYSVLASSWRCYSSCCVFYLFFLLFVHLFADFYFLF